MIKNTLTSIEFEVNEDYNKYFGQWDEFTEKIKDIFDYYKSSIYKSGKIILNNKIGIKQKDMDFTKIDNEFLDGIDFSIIILKIREAIEYHQKELSKKELYDQIIFSIIGECITLFKLAQINQCKNQNITKIKLLADDNYSCDECKVNSKFTYNVENFDNSVIHPFCKISILPISNRITNIKTNNANFINVPIVFSNTIKNIMMKLTIQLKQYLTYKEFIFEENINNISIDSDKVHISLRLMEMLDIESLIVRELLYDKLTNFDLTWWKKTYESRKKVMGDNCYIYSTPFVNNLAQSNYTEYFTQCYISYILHPTILKDIDMEAYNQIKSILEKEFVRG